MKKLTYSEVKTRVESTGKFKLLSKIYINSQQKLEIKCNNGHIFKISIGKWRYRCPICHKEKLIKKMKLLTFKKFVKALIKENYIVLSKSKKYKNQHSLIEFICPKGHKGEMSWNSWRNGNRCYSCSKVKKYSFDEVKHVIEKENYIVLSTEYINNKSKLLLRCPNGHIWETTFNSWKHGNRCKYCYNLRRSISLRKDFSLIRKSFKEIGYEILSSEADYVNAHSKIIYKCPNGHIGTIEWNSWSNGTRCSTCSHIRSQAEIDLENILKTIIPNDNIIIRDRKLIAPYELDFVVPAYKIAIEYCGLYWHSEKAGKDKFYHLMKLEKCKQRGYRLITIFEDEWLFNRDIVIDKLYIFFNKLDLFRKIYARNCKVRSLTTKEAREFCDANHLQGYVNSSIKYGLDFNNELVGVMTFSRPNRSKGRYKQNKKIIYELSRLCFKTNLLIIGGASKLLTYFITHNNVDLIFSYADRRWSNGDLYYKLGFKLASISSPNYYYIINNRRVHRFKFRKSELRKFKGYSDDRTEWEIMSESGYNRIWDCGHLKFERSINGN